MRGVINRTIGMRAGSAGTAMFLIALVLGASAGSMAAEADPPRAVDARELPVLDEASSLGDYLLFAALNNPGLEAAYERWQAALEKIPQAKALPDPRLSYSYFLREVETRVGPQQQKFGITQGFPWFGELGLKGDMAIAAAEATRLRYEAAKLALNHEVEAAYFEYHFLRRALTVTEESLGLLENLEAVVRSRYRTGSVDNSALIRSQVERGKLEERIAGLRDRRRPLSARLNAALGRDSSAEIPWIESIPEMELIGSEDELRALMAENNPQLLALAEEERRQSQAEKLAGKQGYPDFALGLGYIQTGEARMPGVDDSGRDPLAATLSLSIPLWRGKYGAARREAAARRRSVEQDRLDLRNKLGASLETALYEYRDAQRKMELYGGSLIPQGEQALAVTEEAFRSGRADFNGLIDAERVLLEFALTYERAVVNRAERLAEIEMLIGAKSRRMTR